MVRTLKVCAGLFLFVSASVFSLMAAPAASNSTGKNTTGIVLRGNNSDTTIDPAKGQPKPVTGTGVTPVAEGNRIGGSVTVDTPRRICSGYQYAGPSVRPNRASAGGYECPAGYLCHANGISFECRLMDGLTPATVLYADDSRCSSRYCVPD